DALPQDPFILRQRFLAGIWAGRYQRYIALHTRIDDEIELKNISEKRLRDRLHIGAIEIHRDAVALDECGRLRRCGSRVRISILLRLRRDVRAWKKNGLRRLPRPAGLALARQ